jgi:hypothetical protein
MTRVVLDEVLRRKLFDLLLPVELCDEAGNVLARVVPAGWDGFGRADEPLLSEVELCRREREPEFSTEEVLAHLEKV